MKTMNVPGFERKGNRELIPGSTAGYLDEDTAPQPMRCDRFAERKLERRARDWCEVHRSDENTTKRPQSPR